ncbi:MAG: PEGA domain-containing protein [Bryobacterales bacterium]
MDQFSGPGEHLYLSPGEHEVRLTRVFYKDHTQKVDIKAGETTLLSHKMEPNGDKPAPGPYGRIKIQPTPELDAGLIVDLDTTSVTPTK